MAAIVDSIEISCRPEDIFSYATDFSHFPAWQGGRRVCTPGRRSFARHRLDSGRNPAGRPSRVGEDRGDHRAGSSPHVGGARCRRPAHGDRERHHRAARPRRALARNARPRLRRTRARQAARSARPPPGAEAATEKRATAEANTRALINLRSTTRGCGGHLAHHGASSLVNTASVAQSRRGCLLRTSKAESGHVANRGAAF
jgi:hypothetical protein